MPINCNLSDPFISNSNNFGQFLFDIFFLNFCFNFPDKLLLIPGWHTKLVNQFVLLNLDYLYELFLSKWEFYFNCWYSCHIFHEQVNYNRSWTVTQWIYTIVCSVKLNYSCARHDLIFMLRISLKYCHL